MKNLKQAREDAEQEYYEKDSRAYRWGVIRHKVKKVSEMLENYNRDYCDCQRCGHSNYVAYYLKRYREYPPEYESVCVRCREERHKLTELICEMKRINETTQEASRQYDEARVARPLHLP